MFDIFSWEPQIPEVTHVSITNSYQFSLFDIARFLGDVDVYKRYVEHGKAGTISLPPYEKVSRDRATLPIIKLLITISRTIMAGVLRSLAGTFAGFLSALKRGYLEQSSHKIHVLTSHSISMIMQATFVNMPRYTA
jgi:hypothetical protein